MSHDTQDIASTMFCVRFLWNVSSATKPRISSRISPRITTASDRIIGATDCHSISPTASATISFNQYICLHLCHTQSKYLINFTSLFIAFRLYDIITRVAASTTLLQEHLPVVLYRISIARSVIPVQKTVFVSLK